MYCSLQGVLFGLISAYSVGSIYGFFQFRKSLKLKLSLNHTKEMLSFSIPLVFSSASIFILTYFDRFMISSMLDTSSLGIYSLGFKLSLIGSIVFSVFKLITTPFIFEHYKSTLSSSFKNYHQSFRIIVDVCINIW